MLSRPFGRVARDNTRVAEVLSNDPYPGDKGRGFAWRVRQLIFCSVLDSALCRPIVSAITALLPSGKHLRLRKDAIKVNFTNYAY